MRSGTRFTIPLLILLGGCTVQLVGPYDETTVKGVTDLHRKVEAVLVDLERHAGTPAGRYGESGNAYDRIRVDLRSLRLRVDALQRKERTVEQIDLLLKSVDQLEQLHQIGFKDREEIAPLRTNFEVIFKSILVVEMGKKRAAP